MKAAYEYYKQTAKPTRKTAPKATLGSINIGSAARLSIKQRPPVRRVQFSAQEQALMKLIDSGAVGAYIAHHAPAAEFD